MPFKQGKDRTITLEPGEAAELDLVHRFESPIDAACPTDLQAPDGYGLEIYNPVLQPWSV